jgi:hypothetical protein
VPRDPKGVNGTDTVQYQTLRSVSDHHVFVLCHDGKFYESVPEEVRHQGPWQVNRRGDVEQARVPPSARA